MFNWLMDFAVDQGVLDEPEKRFFIYALEELVHTTLIVSSIMLLGIWLHNIQAATVFIIIFPITRKYIG